MTAFSDQDVKHIVSRVRNARREEKPFPHAIVESVLPARLYADFCSGIPVPDAMETVAQRHQTGEYPETRLSMSGVSDGVPARPETGNTGFLSAANALAASVVGHALLDRFRDVIAPRVPPALKPKGLWVGASVEMIRDESGFALRPHTDGRRKLLTGLLYAPETEETEDDLGTELYVPIIESATSDGTGYFDPSQFRVCAKAPYAANTMLVFPRTDRSFHGVAAVKPGSVRRLIQISLMALKETAPEAQFAFHWKP